jgi:hypothetical protein
LLVEKINLNLVETEECLKHFVETIVESFVKPITTHEGCKHHQDFENESECHKDLKKYKFSRCHKCKMEKKEERPPTAHVFKSEIRPFSTVEVQRVVHSGVGNEIE